MTIQVSGSAVAHRLRSGETVTTRLDYDKALYQGIDDGGGLPNPNWLIAANQPTITPAITRSLSTDSVAIIAGSAVWKYNGVALTFGTDGISNGAYAPGLFQINTTTGALKIIGNLASLTNTNVDSLRFDAVANVGYETPVGADIEVRIELVGKNSYTGVVDSSTKTLKEGVTDSITASAKLAYGLSPLATFKTEWLKGGAVFKTKSSEATCNITRADVSGSQVFTCNFYATIDGVDTLVSSYMFVIYDSSDPYDVVVYDVENTYLNNVYTSLKKGFKLIKRSDGSEITSGVTWTYQAKDCRGLNVTLATPVISTYADGHKYVTVTIADEDRKDNGTYENGEITIEATATF